MRLYHSPGSRSTRVVWALEEIGTPYDVTLVTREDRRTDAHLARHPLRRVPVLELDDGQLVFESAAVCLQLADLYPEAGLIGPLGSNERALTYQWTLFAMTEMENRVFEWLFAKRRGEELGEHEAGFAPIADALRAAVGRGPWLAGDAFTVADIFCATMLGNAFHNGLLTEDGPLRDYVERARARPAYERAEARDR
jgi:glutathione S-transferase